MNTNFDFPTPDELFSSPIPPVSAPCGATKSSNGNRLVIGGLILLVIVGGCTAFYYYNKSQKLNRIIIAEQEKNKEKVDTNLKNPKNENE